MTDMQQLRVRLPKLDQSVSVEGIFLFVRVVGPPAPTGFPPLRSANDRGLHLRKKRLPPIMSWADPLLVIIDTTIPRTIWAAIRRADFAAQIGNRGICCIDLGFVGSC